MQDNHSSATSGLFDSASGNVNPYAPGKEGSVPTEGGGAPRAAGPFAAAGWEKVQEGLVLVYLGSLLAIVSVFAALILALAGPAMAAVGMLGIILGGLSILVGQWMCRGVPRETGLREAITIACVGVTYQWLSGLVMMLNPWLHLAQDTLAAIRLSNGAAQLVAISCFLWFLAAVARRTSDEGLLTKAHWVFRGFLAFGSIWLLLRLVSHRSTGHLAHHTHFTHHLAPLGGLIALCLALAILAVIVWVCAYISLIKALADKINAGR
ncbi:MAG: hypothetical protein ACREHD_31220 [Pirellulales bacterium]